MKRLSQYVNEWKETPNSAFAGADDASTFIMSEKDDTINVEFEYKDEKVSRTIGYGKITKQDGGERWQAELKSKKYGDITYVVSADCTGTGRIGYSTINMKVEVKENEYNTIATIEPKCSINVKRVTNTGAVASNTI